MDKQQVSQERKFTYPMAQQIKLINLQADINCLSEKLLLIKHQKRQGFCEEHIHSFS